MPVVFIPYLFIVGCSSDSNNFDFSNPNSSQKPSQEEDITQEDVIQEDITQEEPTSSLPSSPPLDWPFWMTFHSCASDEECGNPANHTVHLSVSQDSYDWELIDIPSVEGSVPDIFFRNNKLYLYAKHFLYRYDLETLEWEERETVEVYDENGEFGFHVDPNPILDENGDLYLAYLHNDQVGDPAGCRDFPCQKSFRIAKEQLGSDGVIFEDATEMLSIMLLAENQIAADPDLFPTPNGWTLLISRGQMVQAFEHTELVGKYQPLPDLFENRWTDAGGVPAGYYDYMSEEYWTFVTTHVNQDAHTDIFVGRSNEYGFISKTEFEQMTIMEALREEISQPNVFIASPGFWVWEEQ